MEWIIGVRGMQGPRLPNPENFPKIFRKYEYEYNPAKFEQFFFCEILKQFQILLVNVENTLRFKFYIG